MTDCWQHDHRLRPNFIHVVQVVDQCLAGKRLLWCIHALKSNFLTETGCTPITRSVYHALHSTLRHVKSSSWLTAPRYLAADCVPVSEMAQRRHLRSAAGHQLDRAVITVWTHVTFGRSPYLVRDCGTLYLDCCVTLTTKLLAMVILWRQFSLRVGLLCILHIAH